MTANVYETYYNHQIGTGNKSSHPDYFKTNIYSQRGRGIGSVLLQAIRGLASPLIRTGTRALAKQALKTGSQVLSDVTSGRKLSDSVKHRALQSLQDLTDQAVTTTTTRKRRKKRVVRRKVKKRTRRL